MRRLVLTAATCILLVLTGTLLLVLQRRVSSFEQVWTSSRSSISDQKQSSQFGNPGQPVKCEPGGDQRSNPRDVFLIPERLGDARFRLTSSDPGTYQGPIVKGWPPGKDRNMTKYISEGTLKSGIQACPSTIKKVRLLILVKTAAKYADRRQVNRETWVKGQQNKDDILVLNVLGMGADQGEQEGLVQENAKNCDIIQLHVEEGYTNNTLKLVGMLKYAVENIGLFNLDFLFIMDDDSYLNIPRLYDVLFKEKQITGEDFGIWGFRYGGSLMRPGPDDPAFTLPSVSPTYMFDGEQHPAHMSGSGYLLPAATLPCLLQESMRLPYYHIDDVFLTGMAAERCGFPRVHRGEDFHSSRVEPDDVKPSYILIHYMEEEHKRKIADKLMGGAAGSKRR